MRRTIAALLLLTACGGTPEDVATTEAETTTLPSTTTTTSTTIPPTTTTTLDQAAIDALEYEADADLIVQLWRDYSDSWIGGNDAGFQFIADNIHPGEGCTYEELVAHYDWGEGADDEVVIARDTIERDDGWAGGGPGGGTVPEGRIYIHQAQITTFVPGQGSNSYVGEIHTAIVDGQAFFFFACQD